MFRFNFSASYFRPGLKTFVINIFIALSYYRKYLRWFTQNILHKKIKETMAERVSMVRGSWD